MAKSLAIEVDERSLPPGEWREAMVGEVAEVSAGGAAPQGKHYFGGANRFVRVQHVDNGAGPVRRWDLITDEAVKKCRLRLYPKGTILVPKSGASIRLEKRGILLDDSYVVSHLATIISKPDVVDNDFLFFKLASMRLSDEKADGYPTLGIGEIRDTSIQLPPLEEQRSIASVLRAAHQATATTDKVVTVARELRRSLVHHLFTYGPVSSLKADRVPVKDTEFGCVPEAWDVVELREAVAEIDYGFSAPIPKSPQEDGVKIVSTADITADGNLIYSRIRTIVAPPRTVRRLALRGGDILFNWRNSPELVGKTAIFEPQQELHIFASFILRIRTDEQRTHNLFLKHLLNYFREKGVFLLLARRAVNQANYNRNEISALRIPLPPYDEQRLIAEEVAAVDAKLAAEEERRAALTALFGSLLRDLMTGRRRVGAVELP